MNILGNACSLFQISDMQSEVAKMKEERQKFYEGLKEIEKLKQAYFEPVKTKSEEISETKILFLFLNNHSIV